MRRATSISLLAVAVLAIGAVAAHGAPMKKLTLSERGIPLVPGDTFEVFGEKNVEVFTPIGNIECINDPGRNGLFVSDLTNSKSVDELELVETTGALDGGRNCRTNTEPHPRLGEALVVLGWGATLKLRAGGKATLGPVSLELVFEAGPKECTFKGALTGSNNATAGRESLGLELDHKLTLSRSVANSSGCPKTAELSIRLPSNLVEGSEGGENIIEEQI